ETWTSVVRPWPVAINPQRSFAAAQDQGAPTTETNSPVEGEAERPEPRLDPRGLTVEDAGENTRPAGAKHVGDGRSKTEQGPKQTVGKQQIGSHAPQFRMIKPGRLHRADALSNAVLSRIFARDLDGNWIEVARNDVCIQHFCPGDGEDAGAGADIDDM